MNSSSLFSCCKTHLNVPYRVPKQQVYHQTTSAITYVFDIFIKYSVFKPLNVLVDDTEERDELIGKLSLGVQKQSLYQ